MALRPVERAKEAWGSARAGEAWGRRRWLLFRAGLSHARVVRLASVRASRSVSCDGGCRRVGGALERFTGEQSETTTWRTRQRSSLVVPPGCLKPIGRTRKAPHPTVSHREAGQLAAGLISLNSAQSDSLQSSLPSPGSVSGSHHGRCTAVPGLQRLVRAGCARAAFAAPRRALFAHLSPLARTPSRLSAAQTRTFASQQSSNSSR